MFLVLPCILPMLSVKLDYTREYLPYRTIENSHLTTTDSALFKRVETHLFAASQPSAHSKSTEQQTLSLARAT